MASLPHSPDAASRGGLSPAGAEIRDLAVAAVGTRYRTLTERAKQRKLTALERNELDRLEVVLDTLQAMAVAPGS